MSYNTFGILDDFGLQNAFTGQPHFNGIGFFSAENVADFRPKNFWTLQNHLANLLTDNLDVAYHESPIHASRQRQYHVYENENKSQYTIQTLINMMGYGVLDLPFIYERLGDK